MPKARTKKENKVTTISDSDTAHLIRWKLFAKYYILGNKNDPDPDKRFRLANAKRSYLMAYPDATTKTAEVNGCLLLRHPKVQEIMKETLEEAGWNNTAVDGRAMEIIFDGKDADSNTAIKEYNKIKKRTEEGVNSKAIETIASCWVQMLNPKKDAK